MAHLHVYGNIQTIFTTLIERAIVACMKGTPVSISGRTGDRRNPEQERGERRGQGRESCVPRQIQLNAPDKYRSDESPIKPQRLICELTRRLPDETRYLADTGNSFAWTTDDSAPASTECLSGGDEFGAMGGRSVPPLAPPLAHPVSQWSVTGDGSYLMSGQELTVAAEAQLCVLFVVLNDQSLGMIKHGQQMAGAESIGLRCHRSITLQWREQWVRGPSITSVEESAGDRFWCALQGGWADAARCPYRCRGGHRWACGSVL
ncbi:thiamine pyrophosphate-dependent enzyme [Candidatus Reidiella endopervernicosa]|uniref:thiamine pyrophosphate-dependent enzyme n=1 Tax=Candidatus Reidiella endopervernicosa TaxID=2738883 RepID=UPI001F02EC8B|nr:thiamine pyrophosphate-dependent enzyme [Candidatus Reidiella endopervernicosa]